MTTSEFIETLVEDGLDDSTIINFVISKDSWFKGFLVGVLVGLESGADMTSVISEAIEELEYE